MKICHLTSVHESSDIRIFQKMCRSLAQKGFEVFLVAPNAVTAMVDGVNIVGVPVSSLGRIYRISIVAREVYRKALALNADIYHIHDPELLPWAVKLQKRGKKVVYDSHEDVPEDILHKYWIKPVFVRNAISKIFNWYEKRQALKLSGVISVLESITDKFKHPNGITIYNYPRIEYFDSAPFQFTAPLRDKFKLVYNGVLSDVRGIHQMIAAVHLLDDNFRLVLMGAWESKAYEDHCSDLPGWNKVEYLGLVEISQCLQVLKACQVGLVMLKGIPNYLNSLPIKAFEYMAAKLPMVMSDFPFWRYEFGDYANFADPESEESIAAAVREIEANYSSEKNKAEEVSAAILKYKTWNHEAEKLQMFYNNLFK